MQQQEPLIHDFRLLDRTSGEYFWLRLKANSQANEGSGQIIYAEVTDIDAEKKAETMLTLTEKKPYFLSLKNLASNFGNMTSNMTGPTSDLNREKTIK